MSKTKRRRFSADFKAKVALEALKGEQTLSDLATRFDLHPNMIAQWKRQATEVESAARGARAFCCLTYCYDLVIC